METRANYVLVGASVLAALAAIVIFIFWLGQQQLSHQETPYYTYFKGSVTGLTSGSAVRYRGVPVGTVGEIEIDPDNLEQIRVTLKMKQGTPIKIDSIASLEMAGITGGSYVEITGGTQASPPLVTTDGSVPVIKAENSTLQSLFDDLPQLLGKITQLADSANGALSQENIHALSQTFGHLESITANLDALTPDLKQAVNAFGQVAGDLHAQVPQALTGLRQDGQSIKEAADEFRQVASGINTVIDENRAPLREFTGNGLAQVGGLVSQLRDLSVTLTRVADHLDRDPQRYLFGSGVAGGIDPNRPLAAGVSTGTTR
jgi:phospholipid/cholesterol/gamma-HCH transport system substrate-binding protein